MKWLVVMEVSLVLVSVTSLLIYILSIFLIAIAY